MSNQGFESSEGLVAGSGLGHTPGGAGYLKKVS